MVEILSDNSTFYIDRKGSKNNFLIPTLMKRDAPRYVRKLMFLIALTIRR